MIHYTIQYSPTTLHFALLVYSTGTTDYRLATMVHYTLRLLQTLHDWCVDGTGTSLAYSGPP
jgi:hypothetical protein